MKIYLVVRILLLTYSMLNHVLSNHVIIPFPQMRSFQEEFHQFMKKESEMNTQTAKPEATQQSRSNSLPSLQVIEIQEPPINLVNCFKNAFRSKVGTEIKPTESHKWVKQDKYMLHQTYPIGTWFIDLVKFGDYWYVFFVEACSRYLIVIQGNSNFLTESSTEVNLSGRVPTDTFKEVFQQFEKMNVGFEPNLLIGDSEKAFWSQLMRNYYKSKHISTKIINVSQDGHIGMSILDRCVRTIRDMCYKLNLPENCQPVDLINVVITYNNTFHKTFEKALRQKYSPLQMHNNQNLQGLFRIKQFEDNLAIRLQNNFIIGDNVEVVVKKEKKNKFEKIRTNVLPGKWFIKSHNLKGFKVENSETHEILEDVPRSQLRPIF